MLQTIPRRIAAAAAAIAVVMIALFYVAVLRPQMSDLKKAHAARSAAEAKSTQLDGQVTQLKGLLKRIPADQADLASLQQSLPDNPSLDTALSQLHAAATAAGVTLTTVSPSSASSLSGASASKQAGGPSVSLNLNVTGSPGQVSAFLTLLNQMPRVVVVDHLTITSGNTATIGSRIFYAGQPTP